MTNIDCVPEAGVFSNLCLLGCGRIQWSPGQRASVPGRQGYRLFLVLEGGCRFADGELSWVLQPGQGILGQPGTALDSHAQSKGCTCLWVDFDGPRAQEVLGQMGLTGKAKAFRCPQLTQLRVMGDYILDQEPGSLSCAFLGQSLLYMLFSQLPRMDAPSPGELERQYVAKAMDYIRANLGRQIRVLDVAAHVGLSRGYLHKLFIRHLGLSPQEYLIRLRLNRSRELLAQSTLSVDAIARSCGYSDPLVFSKLFKKKTGTTPSGYRKSQGPAPALDGIIHKDR